MGAGHFDVAVVGAGPAGAVAAIVLARGGASVALVDKAGFPRDKACGDVVGPRGLAVLDELGLIPDEAVREVRDLVMVGPAGGRVTLPCRPGRTYPDHGFALARVRFDAALVAAAGDAGAEVVRGRVAHLCRTGDGTVAGVELDDGRRVLAPVVIGADGATSRVAEEAGLVDAGRVLWGFALRVYLDEPAEIPSIVLWSPERGRAFPGYGWLFPGADGRANAGLGIGTLSARRAGAEASRLLPAFLDHLRALGLVRGPRRGARLERLGGWLKMGMVGTVPAAAGVLLVGDAAGLVNPLQGEGIAHALSSGRRAAQAVLDEGGDADLAGGAAGRYRAGLLEEHRAFHRVAAGVHAALVGRPAATDAVGRLLTTPVVGRPLAGGWALYWNELLDGACPGRARTVAAVAARLGDALVRRSDAARWFAAATSVQETPVQEAPVQEASRAETGRQCLQAR